MDTGQPCGRNILRNVLPRDIDTNVLQQMPISARNSPHFAPSTMQQANLGLPATCNRVDGERGHVLNISEPSRLDHHIFSTILKFTFRKILKNI